MKHIDITHDGVVFNWQLDPMLAAGHILLYVASDVAYSEQLVKGMPRTDYKRVVNVIPASATEDQAVEIFRQAWRDGKQTCSGSYDDAGIGALSDKTALLHLIPADRSAEFVNWYNVNYPGTQVLIV